MSNEMTAAERVHDAYRRIREIDRPEVWISLRPEADCLAEARRVDQAVGRGEALPLAGKVVAVKDNIDVLGLPTTAACPAYAYRPAATAPSVTRLVEAGAIVIGKTNMDQFATGLVGTRTPYGAVRNAWRPDRISGGSSSGSAVAVALGLADLGIGTDTAGSGRVPAAFQGIVGFKPTLGRVSMAGIVPASRSFDCVSVFAASANEAEAAVAVMSAPGAHDLARRPLPSDAPLAAPAGPVVAVPAPGSLGELAQGWDAAFSDVVGRLAENGARIVEIDIDPFLEGAELLYGTALVAERYAAVGEFLARDHASVDPNVREIILAGRDFPAYELVRELERAERARVAAMEALGDADVLLLPTTGEHPSIADVATDPIAVNRRLGRFTSFANVFDLAAVAVPAAAGDRGPFGVTVFARAFADAVAADVARLVVEEPPPAVVPSTDAGFPLLVVGAHMTGQPLSHELSSHGARFLRAAATRPLYRMYALETSPRKPGLIHVGGDGTSVAGELWLVPRAGLGALLAGLPEPMTLGPATLDDGSKVTGFFCQASATTGATDISSYGGWRSYLAAPVNGSVA